MISYKKLSKDDINGLPLIKYQGDIQVFSDENHIEEAIEYLFTQKVIGFDTETRPTFTKGTLNAPSIIQLAGDDIVFIFQLDSNKIFKKLSQILSDTTITKCGVSVDRDLIELMYLNPFNPCSFIDLGDIARMRGIPHHGLRGLAALLLKHRISKSSQTSDWSRKTLSHNQINYAATDAWISLELFKKFDQESII